MSALSLLGMLVAQPVAGSVLSLKPPINSTSFDSFEAHRFAAAPYPRDGTSPSEESPWEDFYDYENEWKWNDALCRGDALVHAMTLSGHEAALALNWPHLQSPWNGDIKAELKTWGWLDSDENHNNADTFCNFGKDMGNLLQGLKVDGRSAQMGGPNHCFFLEHRNGSTVKRNPDGSLPAEVDQKYDAEGREYRVTGAYSRVGINRKDGIVYFLHRVSPEKGAEMLWDNPSPDPAALPKIRSSSDLTFGLWNRVAASDGNKIEKFVSMNIVNEDAEDIIKRALETVHLDDVQAWPGTDFDMMSDAVKALLASPVGLGAAYFLLQH
ncbi:hypothetical protein G6514_001795 [Epicoccum nigrum]|nr:hypothetical protein G6514_001795 [Epicoccum nigrum]